jgi:hypothetical protein
LKVVATTILAAAACANAAVSASDATPEELGIPRAAFVAPELARKAAVLEACIENPEPSLAVTAALYPDIVEAWDAADAPLYFYEVIVVGADDERPDYGRLTGLLRLEAGTNGEAAPGATGTWALTAEGENAARGFSRREGGPVYAMMLVPASTAYPMLVVPSAGFALWRPALTAAAAEIIRGAEFGAPRAVVAGTGQYLLFESNTGTVAFEIFDYKRVAAERRPYFTGAGALEAYVEAQTAPAPGGDEDERWTEAMRSLWPWLDENIPDGATVTVDAAEIEHKYNKFMQAQMDAR